MSKRRPRIYCFGCSHTMGIEGNNNMSWVDFLARKLPDYDFYKLGDGGSSELFHAFLMSQMYPKKEDNDIFIFQMTHVGRLTWWNDIDFTNSFKRTSRNVYCINQKFVKKNIEKINYGTLKNTQTYASDSTKKLAAYYYGETTDIYVDINYISNIAYAGKYFDYGFMHYNSLSTLDNCDENLEQYDCFSNSIGKELWSKFQYDSGKHLTLDGLKYQSEWIYKNLIKRNILNVDN